MAVVARARHVLADVVEQRRVLEQLAVGVAESVQSRGGVEQLECEQRHLSRVRLGPVAPAGETVHRLAPDRTRVVGPVAGVVAPDRVEHDPFA